MKKSNSLKGAFLVAVCVLLLVVVVELGVEVLSDVLVEVAAAR